MDIHKIGIVLAIGGISFAFGMHYQTTIQTCDILDVAPPVKEAYCNVTGETPRVITEYVPRYIKTECEVTECACKNDWESCVNAYETVTSKKTPKRTEILPRNYRR